MREIFKYWLAKLFEKHVARSRYSRGKLAAIEDRIILAIHAMRLSVSFCVGRVGGDISLG